MLVTEKQARMKWCPEVRVPAYHPEADGDDGPASSNRFIAIEADEACVTDVSDFPQALRCLGSACMMWRWSRDIEQVGYCGKAGKP